jgi:hypothetical protein
MWYDVYYKLIVYIVRSGQELLCTKKAGYDAGLNETMAKCPGSCNGKEWRSVL